MKSRRHRWVELLLILGTMAVVLVATLVGPGCGTIANQAGGKRRIYGGCAKM